MRRIEDRLVSGAAQHFGAGTTAAPGVHWGRADQLSFDRRTRLHSAADAHRLMRHAQADRAPRRGVSVPSFFLHALLFIPRGAWIGFARRRPAVELRAPRQAAVTYEGPQLDDLRFDR